MTAKDMKTIQPLIHKGGVTRGVSESLTPDQDITELLKRLPKPQKSISLEYLLSKGLPFLNAKDEDGIVSSVKNLIEPLVEMETGEQIYPITLAGWENKYSTKFFSLPVVRKNLVEVHSKIRLLINSTVTGGKTKEVMALNLKKYMEPLEPMFNLFLSQKKKIIPDFKFGIKERKRIKNQDSFNKVWVKALPAIIVCFTIAAIRDGAYRVVEKGINSQTSHLKASATDYIGMCPRCETVFEKNQSNTEYCSRSCAVMDSRDRLK